MTNTEYDAYIENMRIMERGQPRWDKVTTVTAYDYRRWVRENRPDAYGWYNTVENCVRYKRRYAFEMFDYPPGTIRWATTNR